MNVISGQMRYDLEELVKQLRAHGAVGASEKLSNAMQPFRASSTHYLALSLANMLLSLQLKTEAVEMADRESAQP